MSSRAACGRYMMMKACMAAIVWRRSSPSLRLAGACCRIRSVTRPPGLMLLPKRVDQIGELSRLSKPQEDEDEVPFRFLMIVLDDVADDIGGI